MSHLPSVSVVIPAYKQAHLLERCLDSVAAQTYRGHVEVIVVDDGSPDESAEVARAHALAPIVIEQENTGVSGARNTGIARATGDYIAFLDADDAWSPQKLERHLDVILESEDPVCLSCTRYQRVNEAGEPFVRGGEHPATNLVPEVSRLMRQNFIGTSTAIAHRRR